MTFQGSGGGGANMQNELPSENKLSIMAANVVRKSANKPNITDTAYPSSECTDSEDSDDLNEEFQEILSKNFSTKKRTEVVDLTEFSKNININVKELLMETIQEDEEEEEEEDEDFDQN